MEKIVCLGCGTIGSSWAAFFASKGLSVKMCDQSEEGLQRARENVEDTLDNMLVLGLISQDESTQAKEKVSVSTRIEESMSDCDLVQESIIEDYEIKAKVYRDIEQVLPAEAIISSSTSGLLMTRMQSVLKHPERAIIAHPFNPPHFIPLVELVVGKQTSKDTLDKTKTFFDALGKTTVVLNKEMPGHIANRLAAALWREALHLVDEGVASVEDVDATLTAGLGLRWAVMGPHLTYQLGGGEKGYEGFIEGIGKTFEKYWETMPEWTSIPEGTKSKAIAGMQDFLGKHKDVDFKKKRDEEISIILKHRT